MTIANRLAEPGDLSAVEALVKAAYTPYVARIGREPGPMLDDYRALIAQGVVRLATEADAVLGLLVVLPDVDALLLDNIAVAPDAQGRGVGRRLLAVAEDIARARGYRAIKLYTNEMMTENIAIYTRLGYVETHRVEEKGFRRVYMRKALA